MDININVIIALTVIVGLLYVYLTRNYGFWSKRGIPTVPNALPGLGNTWPLFAMTQNYTMLFHSFYKKGKGQSMIGFYDFSVPGILLRDPELVKLVLVTNFHKFANNLAVVDPQNDPIFAKNPFFTEGDKWKSQRAQLTRMLSTAKLKMFLNQVSEVCGEMNSYIEDNTKGLGTVELEMKKLFSRYTSETVANSVFGLKGYSFDDNYKGRSFLNLGEAIFHPSMLTTLKTFVAMLVPFLGSFLQVSFVPRDVDAELRQMIDCVVDDRVKKSVVKNDILQVILESDKADQIDKEYVLNHACAFFFDMFETTGTTMTYVVFQLATNLDVQERVRDELISALKKHNDVLSYEVLKELTYMDQVISESVRLNSVLGAMNKVCTEKFELVGSDGLTCVVEPGNIVSISIQGLHYDEEYWQDPTTFDPDRFSDENKNDRHKFVHLPFGEGPRMCPGRILAAMMLKSAFVHLLQNYSLTLSTRTKMPLQYDPYHFLAYPLGGVWINLTKIV